MFYNLKTIQEPVFTTSIKSNGTGELFLTQNYIEELMTYFTNNNINPVNELKRFIQQYQLNQSVIYDTKYSDYYSLSSLSYSRRVDYELTAVFCHLLLKELKAKIKDLDTFKMIVELPVSKDKCDSIVEIFARIAIVPCS